MVARWIQHAGQCFFDAMRLDTLLMGSQDQVVLVLAPVDSKSLPMIILVTSTYGPDSDSLMFVCLKNVLGEEYSSHLAHQ